MSGPAFSLMTAIMEHVQQHGWPQEQRGLCIALGRAKQTISKTIYRLRAHGIETPEFPRGKHRRGGSANYPPYPQYNPHIPQEEPLRCIRADEVNSRPQTAKRAA